MKPEIFIGSSKESKKIAYAVQEELTDDANVTLWSQGIFRLSTNTIDELLEALDKSDFSVFIFSPDDTIEIREETFATVRDNVIFELGLSIGKLGKRRSFFILPEDNKDIRLPTDLLGFISATYDAQRTNNLQAAVGPACNKIRKAITELGKRKKPLVIPDVVMDQPEDWYYHFRVQKLYPEDEKFEPDFSFNSTKSSFANIWTRLHNRQHVPIGKLTIDSIDISSRMVGLMVLRSKERADTEVLKRANIETKEQFWHELRYSHDVVEITSDLDISNY